LNERFSSRPRSQERVLWLRLWTWLIPRESGNVQPSLTRVALCDESVGDFPKPAILNRIQREWKNDLTQFVSEPSNG
jgi:hypothetical protein